MSSQAGHHDEDDLSEFLQELRVLLQGAQVLTAFLIVLPFNADFSKLDRAEQWVYVATFLLSVTSLAIFSAPAAQHRLLRPLQDRQAFKDQASRFLIVGLMFVTLALILATQLVVSQVLDSPWSVISAAAVGVVIVALWWAFPLRKRDQLSARGSSPPA
jgi:heme/copper-type cytochrome/quinol oxidase subunit 1